MHPPLPAKSAAARAYEIFNLASFTVGAKVSTTINVAVQLQDAHGKNLSQIAVADVYVSDNADGSTLTGTAMTSAIAVATNGVVLVTPVSGKLVKVLTNGTGQFDLNLIQTASPQTFYLCVVMPDGSVAVSGAITF